MAENESKPETKTVRGYMKSSIRSLILLWLLLISPVMWAGMSRIHIGGTLALSRPSEVRLAHAIAKAEGFGMRRTTPTRYHNPGDLKAAGFKYEGQIGIGKGRHVIFASDADGWSALFHQVSKMMSGDSRHYSPRMTIEQVARLYAGDWRHWSRNVAWNLGVPENTKLEELT